MDKNKTNYIIYCRRTQNHTPSQKGKIIQVKHANYNSKFLLNIFSGCKTHLTSKKQYKYHPQTKNRRTKSYYKEAGIVRAINLQKKCIFLLLPFYYQHPGNIWWTLISDMSERLRGQYLRHPLLCINGDFSPWDLDLQEIQIPVKTRAPP